jgi:hypothetical protein
LEREYRALLAEHDVDVVLTGEGGDATLLGPDQYPFFIADLLLRGRLPKLWQDVGQWAETPGGRRSRAFTLFTYGLHPALRYLRSIPVEYRPVPIPWASAAFQTRMDLARRGRSTWLPPAQSVQAAYLLQRMMISTNIIATQHHHRHIRSDLRHPLLYRPLVEFMLRIPAQIKFAPGSDRVLQRRSFVGILPEKTLQRRSKGGSCQPHIDGLEGGRAWRRALTAAPRLVHRGYARLDEWREAVQRACFGRMIGLKFFGASATLELWLQQLESEPHGRELKNVKGNDSARTVAPPA